MTFPIGQLHDQLRRVGYEVIPLPVDRLLRRKPDVILDVGANDGQFGKDLRKRGYAGRIVSFEPVPHVFERLQQGSRGDGAWEIRNEALGAEEARLPMHVANHDASSSLLPPSERMGVFADFLEFETAGEVSVRRLDDLFDTLCRPEDRVAMKVDTQGYESAVLEGAEASLDRLDAVTLELSLTPLYEGELPMEVIMDRLRARGFAPAYIAPAFVQRPSRRWIQADVLFIRDEPGPT